MTELCARCGKPTPYDKSTPIEMRCWYVEGAGQLECWRKLYDYNTDRKIDPENELHNRQW